MAYLVEEMLSEADLRKLDRGRTIKCPYKRCKGIVRKVPVNGQTFYTEFEYESLREYRCSKNENHRWGT